MAEFQDFEIEQDFTDIAPMAGGEFDNLPIGDYEFAVKHIEQKPSSKNNPMIVMTFEVTRVINAPGVAENEQAALVGRKAWNNYSLMPKAQGRLKQFMVACNGNLDKFRAGEYIEARFLGTITHSKGEARIGADGQPEPAKVFANVSNERSLETEAPAEVEAPPVTKAPPPKAAATTKAALTANGKARTA